MTSLELLRDLDITSAVINHICFINKLFLPSLRIATLFDFMPFCTLTFQMVLLREDVAK